MPAYDKLSIYIPERSLHLIEALKAIARETDRSLNYVILQALADYVEAQK